MPARPRRRTREKTSPCARAAPLQKTDGSCRSRSARIRAARGIFGSLVLPSRTRKDFNPQFTRELNSKDGRIAFQIELAVFDKFSQWNHFLFLHRIDTAHQGREP